MGLAAVTVPGATLATEQDLWVRIAERRPRLRPHVRITAQRYRGETWYVLHDRAAARFFRFNAMAWRFLAQLDGTRTVGAVLATLAPQLGDEPAVRKTVLGYLNRLHHARLLEWDVPDASTDWLERRQQDARRQRLQRWLQPLTLRFPLCDPERVLERFLPLVRPLFGRPAALLWLTLVVVAFPQAIVHWPELSEHWAARGLDPLNLLLLWILYPLVKGLHELGHAVATKF